MEDKMAGAGMPQPASEKSVREQAKDVVKVLISLAIIGFQTPTGATDDEKAEHVKKQLDMWSDILIKGIEQKGISLVKREVIPGLSLDN